MISKVVSMSRIKDLLKKKDIVVHENLGVKKIIIDSNDTVLMDLCFKLSCLIKERIVTVEEFKKSQIQDEFKELFVNFLKSCESGDFSSICDDINDINIGYLELKKMDKKSVKKVDIDESETVKETKPKTDIEEMESTFKLEKRPKITRGKK